MQNISVVTVTKNEEKNITRFLEHVKWANEIIIVDNGSTDKTIELAKKYTQNIFINREKNLGILKNFAISKARSSWLLLLDVDEIISDNLKREIHAFFKHKIGFNGFNIAYQNHFFGHKLTCSAQQYSKIRLFRKSKGLFNSDPLHEEVTINGKIGNFRNRILHYSFRSIPQVLKKFTYYASVEAEGYHKKGIRLNWKHLTLYPFHMFWSIFVKDEGYRDGIWGFALALCFTYYELARYLFLLFYQLKIRKIATDK